MDKKFMTNTLSDEEFALLVEDAGKWRDWTKGEYRLICKEKYAVFVEAYQELKKLKKAAE